MKKRNYEAIHSTRRGECPHEDALNADLGISLNKEFWDHLEVNQTLFPFLQRKTMRSYGPDSITSP